MTSEYTPPANGFRTFLIVWGTQSISVFGSALTFFALNIWLLQSLYPKPEQKPQLALAISAMGLCFAIPTVFGAPLAGAWADRHDRKRTMMAMDFANGLVSLAYMALVITGRLSLGILLALITCSSILGAFHASAFDTSYAMLVPKVQLPRANGMMQSIYSLSGILSPGVAAAIIAVPALARRGGSTLFTTGVLSSLHDGTSLAMAVDALTFFLAAATLLFLFIPSPQRTDVDRATGRVQKSFLADVKEGAVYIWHRRPLLWLLGTFTVANFMAAPFGVFQPLVLKFNLLSDWSRRGFSLEAALALLTTTGAAGGLAGGLLVSTWGGLKKRRVLGILFPMILGGIGMIGFGLSTGIFLAAAMCFVAEGVIPVLNAHSQAIWQTQTPHELQGRVFSVRRVIAQCTYPVATALAGLLGGLFNPGAVLAVLGGLLVGFCLVQLFNPVLLRVEDKAYLDDLAAKAAAGD